MLTDWLSMDDAPTDGRIVLGCEGKGEDFHVYEMRWEPTHGWGDPQWDGQYTPTNWMPRPPEPEDRSR